MALTLEVYRLEHDGKVCVVGRDGHGAWAWEIRREGDLIRRSYDGLTEGLAMTLGRQAVRAPIGSLWARVQQELFPEGGDQ